MIMPKDISTPQKQTVRKIRSAFGRRLEQLRLDCGYDTQAAFAILLGVEAARYGRWERGETQPNIETLSRLQVVTNACLNKLIVGVSKDGKAKQENLHRHYDS